MHALDILFYSMLVCLCQVGHLTLLYLSGNYTYGYFFLRREIANGKCCIWISNDLRKRERLEEAYPACFAFTSPAYCVAHRLRPWLWNDLSSFHSTCLLSLVAARFPGLSRRRLLNL